MPRYGSSAASALLGAALAAVAFGASGGFQLDRLTWTEIALVLTGGLLIAIAMLRARAGGGLSGAFTTAAFVGLAALVAISIAWSIAPDDSWLEANLTITYVVVFAAAAALARLVPGGATIVLRAIVVAAAAVVLYALATRVWPSLDAHDVFARLGAPYSYWNALGATAALAVPPTLWLGARRSGHAPVSALAYPLLSLFVVTIFLSYSRAAIVVAGVGAVAWVAFVPLRLRSISLLGVALAGAAPVIVWALGKDAFTKNGQPLSVRENVAPQFGLFILATAIVMLGAGLAIGFRVARRPPHATARLRLGVALAVVACAVPIVLSAVLGSSDRGLGGAISAGYESLTSTSQRTSGGPGRLLSASSSRGLYWHQARKVFDSHYWKGTGANTFGVARLRFRQRSDQSVSQNAHGYVHQTAADLGIAGLAVSLVLLAAWLLAAGRAVGAVRRRRAPPHAWSSERVGLAALALAAVVYGLHSTVDWIYYVPGPTVMALVAAGFVAGRGPLAAAPRPAPALAAAAVPAAALPARALVPAGAGAGVGGFLASAPPPPPPPPPPPGAGSNGSASHPPAAGDGSDAPTQSLPGIAPPPPPPPPPRRRTFALPGLAGRAARPLLALLAVLAALICAWTIWQPLRSDRQSDHALDLAAEGKTAQALATVNSARSHDPLTPRPLVVRASIEQASGQPQTALHTLERAVKSFPGDPQTWLGLAQYQLNTLGHPADALAVIQGALYLDPQSRAAQTVFFQANAALHPPPPPPPPAPIPAPAPAPAPAAPAPTPKHKASKPRKHRSSRTTR